MDNDKINKILKSVKSGRLDVKDALDELKHLPYEDVGFAKVDHHRELRHGIPEVIFAAGKERRDVKVIADSMLKQSGKLLVTKADKAIYKDVSALCKKHKLKADYYEKSGVIAAGADMAVAISAVVRADDVAGEVRSFIDLIRLAK